MKGSSLVKTASLRVEAEMDSLVRSSQLMYGGPIQSVKPVFELRA